MMAKCCVNIDTIQRYSHLQDTSEDMTTMTTTMTTATTTTVSKVANVVCEPPPHHSLNVARNVRRSRARTRIIVITTAMRRKCCMPQAIETNANKMNVITIPESACLAKRRQRQRQQPRACRNIFIRTNSVISMLLFTLLTLHTNDKFVSASTVTNIDSNNIPFFTYTPASASSSYEQLFKQEQLLLHQKQQQLSLMQQQQQRSYTPMRPSADQMVRNIDTMSALIDPVVESDLVESPAFGIGGSDSGTLVPFAGDQATTNKLANTQCQMPITWAGKWYQRGTKDPIKVSNSGISDKGVCRERKGDKFLFEHPQTRCLVCMVIIERHLNVLQYKESPADCQQDQQSSQLTQLQSQQQSQSDTLERLCSEIAGDAQLDTLFRIDTPPIECPIVGHYTFTYDNCKDPVSSLESCTDKRQLNFRFNACPDVPGSEIKTEVLKCYADWTEGSNFYMIGRLESASNGADRGKFRCYMYEKSGNNDYLMAQSQDESCDGLISASDGPRSMRITARVPHEQRCQFPAYLNEQQNWLHVDNSLIYMFGSNSSTFHVKETKEGNIIEESTCVRSVPLPPARSTLSPAARAFEQFIVQTTKNCQTLNYCLRIYRRAVGLIQIEVYHHNPHHRDECTASSKPSFTITLTNAEHQPCPFNGAFSVIAPADFDLTYNPSNIFMCPRQSLLVSQCDDPSRISVHSRCTSKITTKNLYCQGSWTSQQVTRLLLSDDDRQRYFATYRESTVQPQFDPGSAARQLSGYGANVAAMVASPNFANEQQSQQQIIEMSILPIVAPRIAPSTMHTVGPATPTSVAPSRPVTVRLARRGSCADMLRQSTVPPFGNIAIAPVDSNNPGYLGVPAPNYDSASASSACSISLHLLTTLFTTALVSAIVRGVLAN